MMKTLTHNIYRLVLLAFIVLCIGLSHTYAQFSMGNTLAPLTGSLYPIIFANDAKGGHHQVADITARNAIPALRRIQGMLCTVLDAGSGTPKTYQLIGGIADANWVVFSPGSSALSTVATTGNFSDLLGKPTTVAGYGILDAMTTAHPANVITSADITNWQSAYTGRISSVSGTAPLLLGLSSNVLTASMPAATNSTDGYATAAQITAIEANTSAMALKANITSPAFLGSPTAMTPAIKDSTTSLATTAFVTAAVSASTIADATTLIKGKILLAGDLTGSADAPVIADGKVTTTKIADANVTYAKIQNITPARLLGNPTGTAGASHEIALGKGLNFSNDSLYTNSTAARDTFTADITVTSNPGLGIYPTNAIIPAKGKTANEVLLLALTPLVQPAYTQPSATISGSPTATTYEIYNPLSITLTGTFIAGDAGAAGAPVYSGGVNSTTLSANPDVIAAGAFASPITYKVTYTYAAGAVRKDNLGNPYGTAIAAGSVTSGSITYTPVARRYWGRCAGSTPTSAEIIAVAGGGTDLTNSNANTCTILTASPTITNYYFYAYPATLTSLVSAFIGGFESLPTLSSQTINVDKNGKTISYKVYVSTNPTSGDVNLIAK